MYTNMSSIFFLPLPVKVLWTPMVHCVLILLQDQDKNREPAEQLVQLALSHWMLRHLNADNICAIVCQLEPSEHGVNVFVQETNDSFFKSLNVERAAAHTVTEADNSALQR